MSPDVAPSIKARLVALGMPLGDALAAVTVNPARVLGEEEIGTLAIGSRADVTVLEESREDWPMRDGQGEVPTTTATHALPFPTSAQPPRGLSRPIIRGTSGIRDQERLSAQRWRVPPTSTPGCGASSDAPDPYPHLYRKPLTFGPEATTSDTWASSWATSRRAAAGATQSPPRYRATFLPHPRRCD